MKTSSPTSTQQPPPSASPAQDGPQDDPWLDTPSSAPRSPALSTASTADGEVSSPELPPLQAPRLPDFVLGLLRTPSPYSDGEQGRDHTSNWGSPYPQHLRRQSVSSEEEPSDDFPIHRLDIRTPFLRPISSSTGSGADNQPSSLVSAAVLANRARRPARGITEDWIRQHTAGVDEALESRHWLSDGSGGSENSSLSGSLSGDEAAWLHDGPDLHTPKARLSQTSREGGSSRKASRRYPRTRSSNETLKQAHLRNLESLGTMATTEEVITPDGGSDRSADVPQQDTAPENIAVPATPTRSDHDRMNDSLADAPKGENNPPVTPPRPAPAAKRTNATPRIKKKVPWKGKSILVLLPRDEERGQAGDRPLPLDESTVANMMKSWEELGYNVRGFDLDGPQGVSSSPELSQSKGAWPDFDEIARERAQRSYKVTLPDLNGKLQSRSEGCDRRLLTCLVSLEDIRGRVAGGQA